MKKCLVVLLALVLVAAAFSMVVAAAPSKEGGLIPSGDVEAYEATGPNVNNKNVQVKVVPPQSKDITPFQQEFNKIKSQNGSMNILAHVDVTADGDTSLLTFPLKVTIPVSGATPGTTGYFLLKKANGEVVRLDANMGNGTATAVFPELGEVVFVSDMGSGTDIGTPDNGSGKETSEKTSDGTAPFIAVIMISALALGVSAKKVFVK